MGSFAKSGLFGRNGGNSPLIDLEFDGIERRGADTDVETYLVNRIVSGEDRGAERAVDFDFPKTFPKTNTTRRDNGKKGRTIR